MSESKSFPPNVAVMVGVRIAVNEFTADEKGEVVAISAHISTKELNDLSPRITSEEGKRVTVLFDIPQSNSLERSAMLFCKTWANDDTPGAGNWALVTLKDFEPKLRRRDLG